METVCTYQKKKIILIIKGEKENINNAKIATVKQNEIGGESFDPAMFWTIDTKNWR